MNLRAVSVYFYTNPHDGLLETHNLDKSLEEKLKCLIFIPIISQTYCDTGCFAWQREFVVFNNPVKEDRFSECNTQDNHASVKSSYKTVKEIAESVGADVLLEGSVQKSDNKVHINVQLIDAKLDI